MTPEVTKSAWDYRVYAIGYGWMDGKPHYTGIIYTEKDDAAKALRYYGKGYVEASRTINRGIASYSRESRIAYTLN